MKPLAASRELGALFERHAMRATFARAILDRANIELSESVF